METRCVLKVYFRGREQMFLPNTASSKLSLSDETKHITFKINLSILSSSLCSFLNAKLAVLNILKVESIKHQDISSSPSSQCCSHSHGFILHAKRGP